MGKKAKKSTTQVDVDEEDEEVTTETQPVAKGGKKGKKKTQNNYWDEEFEKDAQAEEDKSPPEEPSNGSKATKKGKTATFFQVEEDDDEEDSPPVVAKGSKKGKKATEDEKDTPQTADAKGGKKDKKAPSQVVEEDEEEEGAASKSAKGGKKGKKGASQVVEQEDAPQPVAAKGGKKGKKKQDNYWDGEFEEDVNGVKPAKDEDNEVQEEEDKETSKKKQSNGSKPKNEPQGKKSEEITKNENSEKSNGAKGKGQGKSDDKATGKKSNKLVELIKKQQEEKRIASEEAERRRKEEETEEAQRIAEEEEAEKAAQQKKKREPKEPKDPSKQTTKQVAPKGKTAADARFLVSLRERGLLPAEKSVAHESVPKKTNKSEEISGSAPAVTVPVAEPPRVVPKESETVSTPAPVVATPTETITEAADDGDWEDWENRDIEEIVKEPAKPTTKSEQPGPVPTPSAKPNDKEPPKPDQTKEKPVKKEKGNKKGVKPAEEEEEAVKPKEFRTPICCILGHVDTGKTSLLDRIRHTNVQEGEAGGITQQIGATYFPISTLQEQTASLAEQFNNLAVKVPGLLIIDTPGHESFTNLRSRGSGLCDIAILVVDIMHGLEPQTIESINLLRMRKTPFVVALNKVDRIYGWKAIQNSPFRESLKHQTKNAALEFDNRVKEAIAAFAGQELNAVLYYRNKDFRNYVSLVPTSAHSGEGIPDLLMLLVQLTQRMMGDRLYFSPEIQCTVLEVKVTEGHGTTIDVVLVNGVLHEGDTIVLSGMQGPIVTQVRALLTPQPLRELRVKGTYIHHKEIKAAMGIKIVAQDLEKAVAGSALFVAETEDDIDDLKKEVQSDFDSVLKSIDSSTRGVCVQASTLGSLEALLTFLKASKIPVSGVALGPIHRRDVMRASVMLEHNPQYAVILAFDVKVEKDAQIFADEQGVKIFTADIIYHLFDKFTKYMDEFKEKKRAEASAKVVWPCVVRIKPNCVFNKKDPIVLGVEVIDGRLKIGTPLCVPSKECVELGTVTSIEHNHKAKQEAKKGEEVAIKIEASSAENSKTFGRQFDMEDDLVSKISRESIDALKELYGLELTTPEKQLIMKLKTVFLIQ